jgi:hypothetical protein
MKKLAMVRFNHVNSTKSDSHLVAVVGEDFGGNKFNKHKTVVHDDP